MSLKRAKNRKQLTVTADDGAVVELWLDYPSYMRDARIRLIAQNEEFKQRNNFLDDTELYAKATVLALVFETEAAETPYFTESEVDELSAPELKQFYDAIAELYDVTKKKS